MKVRCIRNDSKCLPYHVGVIYTAVPFAGVYEIRDGNGKAIFTPLNGHYLEFIPL